MTDEEIRRTISRCIRYAKINGFYTHAQDFAQEATLALSKGRKTTIPNLFVDYLRHHYGDSRTNSFKLKKNTEFLPTPKGFGLETMLTPKDISLDDLPDGWADYLTDTEIKYLDLCLYGFTQKEIGKLMGFTTTTSSKHYSQIVKKLKNWVKFKSGKSLRMGFKRQRLNK